MSLKNINFFLLSLLLLSVVHAQVFESEDITEIEDFKEIGDIKRTSDMLALVFYYNNPNTDKTEEAISIIEEFSEDYLAVAKIYSVDCLKLGE